MAKELKYLYETTLNKIVEESVTEQREENGQKVEVKKTVKKSVPVKVAILKPDRKLFKGAEIFYAKSLSHYIKEGLLTLSLMEKRCLIDGGNITEIDRKKQADLKKKKAELEAEFFGKITLEDDESKKQKNELLANITALTDEIDKLGNPNADAFENTAEAKSRNDTFEWWSLHLIYLDEDNKGYKPLFKDGTYEEKIASLEDYENKEDPFYSELIRRLSYLVSFWSSSRNTITKIDFETMEKFYVESFSTYKADVVEVKTEPNKEVVAST